MHDKYSNHLIVVFFSVQIEKKMLLNQFMSLVKRELYHRKCDSKQKIEEEKKGSELLTSNK